MYLRRHFERTASPSLNVCVWEVRLIVVYSNAVNVPAQMACLHPNCDRWQLCPSVISGSVVSDIMALTEVCIL